MIKIFSDPAPNYIQSSVDTVLKIHLNESKGDILVFLTSVEEVNRCVQLLNDETDKWKNDKGISLIV